MLVKEDRRIDFYKVRLKNGNCAPHNQIPRPNIGACNIIALLFTINTALGVLFLLHHIICV